MTKGDRYERDFVNLWDGTNWFAQRAAASGAATTNDLPDVTFSNDGIAYAGELKTTSSPYIYIQEEEMRALQRYAAAYGMRAVGIGRFKSERAFYLWNPNAMDRTGSGTYRGSPVDGNWSLKIAEPEGASDGEHPEDVPAGFLGGRP